MNEPAIIRPEEFAKPLPQQIMRPCDYGLELAVTNLEIQLGTIEAYNRLVGVAMDLRKVIDEKRAKAPNPCYTQAEPPPPLD